jgi:hypothetical protein
VTGSNRDSIVATPEYKVTAVRVEAAWPRPQRPPFGASEPGRLEQQAAAPR